MRLMRRHHLLQTVLVLSAIGAVHAQQPDAAQVAQERKQAEADAPRLVEVLELKPGMTVADVGSGFGSLTVVLGHWIGSGRVFSTDITEQTWEPTSRLDTLPSSSEWSFPPRPDTHHVRWIACHPSDPDRLWVAIEAGALVSTIDGGRTWRDRVAGGPWDTHELAVHRSAPDILRVSAGDGYFESDDAGATWRSPRAGLEVEYLRSVAIDPGDPEVVVVSASSGPRTAYVAGRSDGRLYRRLDRERPSAGLRAPRAEVDGRWERVRDGWPEPPGTIAPLLCAGAEPGEIWAADERGVHRSEDGGNSWRQVAGYPTSPQHLRGLALVR